MNIDLLLEKAKPWATPCGLCDYGEPTVACTCPEGDPRPVMSRLVAEIERLRPVVEAAIKWRNTVAASALDDTDALIDAIDALDAEAGAR